MPGATLHRPPPHPRDDLAAGIRGIRKRGLKVRRPGRTVATIDHIIPDDPRRFQPQKRREGRPIS